MKKILSVFGVILSLFLLVACSSTGVDFKEHNYRNVNLYDGESGPLGRKDVLITSMDELQAFYTESYLERSRPWESWLPPERWDEWSEMQDHGSTGAFLEQIRSYTEEYFEENILIAIYRLEGSGSNKYSVKSVKTEGQTVNVFLKYTTPGPNAGGSGDMCAWCILVECEKGGINSLTVKIQETHNYD